MHMRGKGKIMSERRWFIAVTACLVVGFGAVALWFHFQAAAELALPPQGMDLDGPARRATMDIGVRNLSMLLSILFAGMTILIGVDEYHLKREH
jgi:hypothetical protein